MFRGYVINDEAEGSCGTARLLTSNAFERIMAEKNHLTIITRKQAKELGLKKYFTGKLCKRGHIDERWTTDGGCNNCKLQDASAWKKRNKIYVKDYSVKWRIENIEHATNYRKQKYAENPRKELDGCRKWREKNIDRAKQISNDYKRKNKVRYQEQSKIYRKNNPDIYRVANAKRRARKKNAEGKYVVKDIRSLFKKQKGKCVNCFIKLNNNYHVDHILSLSRGGSNWPSNLQLLCEPCNLKKHTKDPFVWAKENGRLL